MLINLILSSVNTTCSSGFQNAVPILLSILCPIVGVGWVRAAVRIPQCGAATHWMVSPTMKALVDAVWAVWSIGASIYDYIHTSAMEERIHSLESAITIHQCVIGLLSAGLVALFTYILLRKHWPRFSDIFLYARLHPWHQREFWNHVDAKLCSVHFKGILTCLTFT